MTTTMTPPIESEIEDATSAHGGVRFINIRANLMPAEVIVARRIEKLRRKILIGLGALVVVVAAVYVVAMLGTRSANNDLSAVNTTTSQLQSRVAGYSSVTKTQAQAAAVQSELATVMQGDLPWSSLITALRQEAPLGIQLTSVSGNVTSAAGSTGSGSGSGATAGDVNQSGDQAAGTLVITGTAASQTIAAAYSDRLSLIKGVTAPLITSLSGAGSGVTFNISATITTAALGGRYATAQSQTATTGGH